MNLRSKYITLMVLLAGFTVQAQQDSARGKVYKNIIRYNLSGAMFFGASKYVVLGYERRINPRQSASLNVGKASLPKIISLVMDSVSVDKDQTRGGFNLSVDYRFYLAQENKYEALHGLYIGPYYSFNHFTRNNNWNKINTSGT